MATLTAPEVGQTDVTSETRFRTTAESALRHHKEPGLQQLQGEIDALTARTVMAIFEPYRDEAEGTLKLLRLAFGQVARFNEGDFRQQASFYLGQLHAASEIAERVRQRHLPKEAVELVTRNASAERILRIVVERGSIGASDLAREAGMKDSNLSDLCKKLVGRELLRSDRFGRRVRYSPTPLTHATVNHMRASLRQPKTMSAAAGIGKVPDWSKTAATAAAASLDAGNVLANTSDFAGGIFTLGALCGADAVVIEPSGDQVRVEIDDSEKKARLRLPKSVGRSVSRQIHALVSHHDPLPNPQTSVFDWRGQRVRAEAELTETGKRYRFEFLDRSDARECKEKVHAAFREIEEERKRLADFQKFYARQVLCNFDGEYAQAAKALGIKLPDLKSMLK
jgi:DNA-binding MarR family transcriptional regulator